MVLNLRWYSNWQKSKEREVPSMVLIFDGILIPLLAEAQRERGAFNGVNL